MNSEHDLIARIERLERRNRRMSMLCGLSLLVPVLCVIGWRLPSDQAQTPVELLKVKSLQVVDDRGVPLITLGSDRLSNGGMITLRGQAG